MSDNDETNATGNGNAIIGTSARRMTRRAFSGIAAAGAGVFGTSEPSSAQTQRSSRRGRRNVLMLIADDHGFEDLGCYGNRTIKTPNIDRLAGRGVRFTNAFCTVASCSASRSVIYSGLFNHTNGQFGHQHSFHNQHTYEWVRGLPALVKAKGYRTAIVNKFHVQPHSAYPFDEVIMEGVNGRDGFAMAEKAREFVERDPDTPFLLVIGYSDPHRDWVTSNDREYPGVERTVYDPRDVRVPRFLPDRPEVREEMADYYQSVSRLDRGAGYILDWFEQSGLMEDTLVIYLSDNGIPFPGAKTTLYDPGIHMPFIVAAPSLRNRGGTNDAMVSFVDIVPTILDWTGAEPPPYDLPGRSFLPVLDEANPKGWDEVYASHTFHEITMYYPMRAVRTRRYKYILNPAHGLDFPFASDLYASFTWQGILERGDTKMGVRDIETYIHRPKEELYDLENDPDEIVNLAADPGHAAVLDGLRKKLRDFQERTKDPWVVKYRYE